VLKCCHISDQVAACVAEVAEEDNDKTVRQAALNVLVALGRPELGALRPEHTRRLSFRSGLFEKDKGIC